MKENTVFCLPPLSLYVHMPWCVAKCPYCDFNSHALRGSLPEAEYISALLADLDAALTECSERNIRSVFFGGGTPSLFGPDSIASVIERIAPCLEAGAEITIEANPGTVEHDSFASYRDAGINRVSLGAQSFDDAKLKQLGRIHAADDIYRAVDELHSAGLANFNLDLMYGLPRQSVSCAQLDVEKAIGLDPAHISHYQLTIEPNTLFAAQPPILPDEDVCWEMQECCQAQLAESGYHHYEVSAYAQNEKQCNHNLNYWLFGDYIGVGAGAHGKITDVDSGSITRYSKLRHPRAYINATQRSQWTERRWKIGPDDRAFEFMLNALRLVAGFSATEFEQRTGMDMARIRPRLAKLRVQGLLDIRADQIMASSKGRTFLNDLVMPFLPDSSSEKPVPGSGSPGFSRLSA